MPDPAGAAPDRSVPPAAATGTPPSVPLPSALAAPLRMWITAQHDGDLAAAVPACADVEAYLTTPAHTARPADLAHRTVILDAVAGVEAATDTAPDPTVLRLLGRLIISTAVDSLGEPAAHRDLVLAAWETLRDYRPNDSVSDLEARLWQAQCQAFGVFEAVRDAAISAGLFRRAGEVNSMLAMGVDDHAVAPAAPEPEADYPTANDRLWPDLDCPTTDPAGDGGLAQPIVPLAMCRTALVRGVRIAAELGHRKAFEEQAAHYRARAVAAHWFDWLPELDAAVTQSRTRVEDRARAQTVPRDATLLAQVGIHDDELVRGVLLIAGPLPHGIPGTHFVMATRLADGDAGVRAKGIPKLQFRFLQMVGNAQEFPPPCLLLNEAELGILTDAARRHPELSPAAAEAHARKEAAERMTQSARLRRLTSDLRHELRSWFGFALPFDRKRRRFPLTDWPRVVERPAR